MRGRGVHLRATQRIAQIEAALSDGPKTVRQLQAWMGGCSDRLARLYVGQIPGVVVSRQPHHGRRGANVLQYARPAREDG